MNDDSQDDDDDRPIGRPNTVVQQQKRSVPWVWEGMLAEGAVTLLSAPEKIGKTTLLSLLLDRRRAGGQLLGRNVYPGKTMLCSEENERLWTLRQPPLDFGPELTFHSPDGPSPSRNRWGRFFNDLCELWMRGEPYDLLVIDTAVSFLPLGCRNPRVQRWALGTLREVADFPWAVLLINQSRNTHRPLAAFADIIIEMGMPRGRTLLSASGRGPGGEGNASRRRIFTGVGRYPETLQSVAAELNPEGTDYVPLPDAPAPLAPLLPTLQALLAASSTPLTHHDLLARWPGNPPRPDSLWRTLARGCDTGLFTWTGAGTKSDPCRFALRKPQTAAG